MSKQEKLTDKQIEDIRQQISDGVPMTFLKDIYGVSMSLLYKIKTGYRRKN